MAVPVKNVGVESIRMIGDGGREQPDISRKETRDVFDVYRTGKLHQYVITVCDETAAERCPVFPGVTRRIHWSFRDPSRVEGSDEEKMAQVRVIRDQIRRQIEEWAPTVDS